VADGRDPRARRDVGQGRGRGERAVAGEQAGAGHHPGHGAAQADEYERGGDGRERHQQAQRADYAQRHQRQGQAQNPSADRVVPFGRRVRVGHLRTGS